MRNAAVGLLLILLAVLLGLAVHRGPLPVDLELIRRLALTPASDPLAIGITRSVTQLGDPLARPILILFLAVWLIMRGSWRAALTLALGSLVAILASTWLKESLLRARPHVTPWLDHPANWSFPSGHATAAAAIFLLMALLAGGGWRVGVALLLAAAVGVSRVMLGVHWPSDVLGGWLLGSGVALVAFHLGQALGSGARPGRRRKTA